MSEQELETNEEELEEQTSEEEESSQEETIDPSEVAAIRKALKKANEEAAKFRHELKELRSKDESETEAAARQAEERVEAKYKKTIVNAEAKAGLTSMGLNANPDRFLKMIDLEGVTITDDGDVAGLKEQLTAIKQEFPEVFKKKVPQVDGGKKTPVDGKSTSTAARLAASYKGEN